MILGGPHREADPSPRAGVAEGPGDREATAAAARAATDETGPGLTVVRLCGAGAKTGLASS
ncbi:hypothetical protein [Streptomyces sp. NPDC058855]|uniref:hypothetical protein n=1 Tax=Streptomyces sp. NPDC058855 TaxID=3346651 RepID=UPI0036B55CA0